jgi:hypothetical protein
MFGEPGPPETLPPGDGRRGTAADPEAWPGSPFGERLPILPTGISSRGRSSRSGEKAAAAQLTIPVYDGSGLNAARLLGDCLGLRGFFAIPPSR